MKRREEACSVGWPFITTTETKQSDEDCLGFGNNRNNTRTLADCVVLGVWEDTCIG